MGPPCKKPAAVNHWVFGGKGSVCTKVCKEKGFTKCNKEQMAGIDSAEKIKAAMKKAGHTCNHAAGKHRSYAGTPFARPQNDDCYYFTPGTAASKINCDANRYGGHHPLCYCE